MTSAELVVQLRDPFGHVGDHADLVHADAGGSTGLDGGGSVSEVGPAGDGHGGGVQAGCHHAAAGWVHVESPQVDQLLNKVYPVGCLFARDGQPCFGCLVGGLVDGGIDWLTQRLSGRKVDWGHVGASALTGWLSGMLGEGLGALGEGKGVSRVADDLCLPNSFTGDTPVLMADGSRKLIKDVRVGDKVAATDPETGESGPRTVTTVIKGTGTKHLTEITVAVYGPERFGDGKSSTLTATDGHPFWAPALHQWVRASDLEQGQWLQTSAGTWVQITAIRHRTQRTTVYNLSVDGLHTYYVVARGSSILAHNCNVALGMKAEGTYSWADQQGYRHFGDYAPDAWQGPVENAIRDPLVYLHVNLKGLGSFVDSARAGLQSGAYATDMEMGWIARAVAHGERSWSSIKFYRPNAKGALESVSVPEPNWVSFGRLRPFISDAARFCGC